MMLMQSPNKRLLATQSLNRLRDEVLKHSVFKLLCLVERRENIESSLKRLSFFGNQEDYSIWSTRFLAFTQTKGLLETLHGTETIRRPPAALPKEPTEAQQNAVNAQMEARRASEIQSTRKNKNTFWCYLVMVLDSTSLMLLKHDCVDANGLGDGQKDLHLWQQRFRSDEKVTVDSVMRQLARLYLKEDEGLHHCFIRAQKLLNRLLHLGEALSVQLFNAMILNGLPERFEHFVVQGSFNLAGSLGEV